MQATFCGTSRHTRRWGWIPIAPGVLALLCLAAAPVLAIQPPTTEWTGTVSNDWFTGGNWDSSVAPNSSSARADIQATLHNPVLLNGSASVATLALGSANSLNIASGGSLTVYGPTISNGGTIDLNGGAGNTFLYLAGNTTLQGGGTVTLHTGTNQSYIMDAASAVTLTNADNMIQGAGTIGYNNLALVNSASGRIFANASGQSLILDPGSNTTNAGLIEATNSGILDLFYTVNNTGGVITANGGAVRTWGATIQGGILNSLNGGTLGPGADSQGTLDGATYSPVTLSAGSTWTNGPGSITYVQGTIVNQGNIQLNGGSGQNTALSLNADTLLVGGGTVTLSGGTGQVYINETTGGLTLSNVDNTIQGYGVIGGDNLALANVGGTINANVSGKTLVVQPGSTTINHGLMEATNGGTLQLWYTIDNSGGNITANGGTVTADGYVVIQGGTLNSLNGGTIGVTSGGNATLDGTTNGPVILSTGSTWTGGAGSITYAQGLIVNQGNIQLNAAAGQNTYLSLNMDTVLLGGGDVTLNNGTGQAYIDETTGGVTLINVDNTIRGAGIIGLNNLAVNNLGGGTIEANVSGQSLTLNPGGNTTNVGVLKATNGGILDLWYTVMNAGGSITADGGVVRTWGATIQGGTLTSQNGGTLGPGAGSQATLDGMKNGPIILSPGSTWTNGPGSTTFVKGIIVNQGNIQLNGGSGQSTSLSLNADTMLVGGGTVTLNDGTGQVFIDETTGGLTLTNADNTIQGYGVIGGDNLAVINNGTLLANSPGNTLLVDPFSGLTNNGTMQANAGSTLRSDVFLSNFSGNTLTGGTYVVNGSAGAAGTLQLSLGSNGGGEIVNNAATIVLNGLNANFFDSNGHNALSNLQNNSGSFTVQGGQQFTASSEGFTNAGAVIVGAGSGSTTAGNYTQTAGTTQVDGMLTASQVSVNGGTLFGAGTIAGSLSVGAGGMLSPGDSPGTLLITGDYTQLGTLAEEIGGTPGSGLFDVINVGGTATLTGGSLDIFLVNAFTPGDNTHYSYIILTAGTIVGTFNGVDFEGLPSGDSYSLDYSQAGKVILDIDGEPSEGTVPEPSFFLPLAGMLAVVAGFKIRRRRSAAAE